MANVGRIMLGIAMASANLATMALNTSGSSGSCVPSGTPFVCGGLVFLFALNTAQPVEQFAFRGNCSIWRRSVPIVAEFRGLSPALPSSDAICSHSFDIKSHDPTRQSIQSFRELR